MTRAQLNKLTGSRAVPDLWHFAPGGTLGGNLGDSVFDLIDAAPQTCPGCGGPAGDCSSGQCDDCLDEMGPGR